MMKATGIGASVLVIIALVIALLKAMVSLVGFLAFAIKIIIVLAFIIVFASVGYMILRGWQNSRRRD